MNRPILGAIFLWLMAVAEQYWPGWNGLFSESYELSDDTVRIVVSIYLSAAVILFFGSNVGENK